MSIPTEAYLLSRAGLPLTHNHVSGRWHPQPEDARQLNQMTNDEMVTWIHSLTRPHEDTPTVESLRQYLSANS